MVLVTGLNGVDFLEVDEEMEVCLATWKWKPLKRLDLLFQIQSCRQ